MGTCGHVTGLLYTIAHFKTSNFKAIPSDVLKTSLPQTWHIPRGEKLKAANVDDVVLVGYDTKTPYRQPRGLRTTLYNPLKTDLPSITDLSSEIQKIDENCLLLSVLNDNCQMAETKFGKYPKGSPIGYQQKLSDSYILNLMDMDFPKLPLQNYMCNDLCLVLDEKKTTSINAINIDMEECHNIEEMTRLQSSDPKWYKVRKDRLTASVAGSIIKRRADMDVLVARLKTTRKVVTENMRHGILFEAVAADSYAKMQGNNVNVYPCGVIVSPFFPWLVASPDRKLYNPSMTPPYGLLEIKCPVKPLVECDYLTKTIDGNYTLKKNHNYYFQMIMQMAVSGLEWCHFYVWLADEYHLECIRFDRNEWQDMKLKLYLFFFNHFLG